MSQSNIIWIEDEAALAALLVQAKTEAWMRLVLLGPASVQRYVDRLDEQEDGPIHVLGYYGGALLTQKLAALTGLTSLDLGGNSIGDEGAKALTALTGLTSLDLSHNSIGDEGAKALTALTGLTSLDLGGSSIGTEGAKALTALTGLTSLSLWSNSIGDEGAKALTALTGLTSLGLGDNSIGTEGAKALTALTGLTSLYLASNSIGDEGAKALTALTGLTSLELGDNSIGDEGAKALTVLTGLMFLGLGNNSIGDEGAKALTALTGLISLSLTDNSIGTEGAKALTALTGLTYLGLRGSPIGDEGAKALTSLTGLTYLYLGGSSIGTEGAKALTALTGLAFLDLGDNSIGDEGAKALTALTGLTSLSLWSNSIGDEGAKALTALTSLTSLDLSLNSIGTEGAKALTALTGLTSLDLWDNSIGDEGAKALTALTGLTSLDLRQSSIGDEGAKALTALTGLTSLDLSHNFIGTEGAKALLDRFSGKTFRLKTLRLADNGDFGAILPPEMIKSSDAQAMISAYQRFQKAVNNDDLHPLNEAKLLVLGDEAVGKTSLIRYLVHNQPRDPDEKKTSGAAIHERIETQDWAPDSGDIRLNVWDFGGQEIMHGTHHYFLTRRSLYLLVLEDRREDDRSIHKWLKIIGNRSGGSPMIVVINKSGPDKQGLRIDEDGLARDYPIVAFLRTSCDADEWSSKSIANLRSQIVTTLAEDERLAHVRESIPAPWLRVKDQIAALAAKKNTLKQSEFVELCRKAGDNPEDAITDDDEQRGLLGLLHDMGTVVAHGLDREAPAVKREITLLDPNWLTGAIYQILNHPRLRDQQGQFSGEQLAEWLDPAAYPAERHEFILSMMMDEDIGLCFELPEKGHYLVPEALPVSSPDYGNWPADSLRFRYRYEFLPKGLIPRFIVAAHRNLSANPTRWQTGVVLEATQCKILVLGDLEKRSLDIAVDGPQAFRRSALNIVLNYLDTVHTQNPGIEPEAWVPLPDNPDLEEGYDHLVRLEKIGGPGYELFPTGSERSYTVTELLDGVRRDRSIGRDREESRRSSPKSPAANPITIRTGDNSPVTVAANGSAATQSPGEPPAPRPGRFSAVTSWHYFSITCGIGAGLVALLLTFLEGPLRLGIGVFFTVAALISLLIGGLNPARFYRRLLGFVIVTGFSLLTFSGSLKGIISTQLGFGVLEWNATVDYGIYAVFIFIVGALIWADIKQAQPPN